MLTIRDNTVHYNPGKGISTSGYVRVIGNTVYGHMGSNGVGLSLSDSEASQNVVYGNRRGSTLSKAWSAPTACTTTPAGDHRFFDAQIRGNTVYSNSIGVLGQQVSSRYFYGDIVNNLIYANTNQGILISDGRTSPTATDRRSSTTRVSAGGRRRADPECPIRPPAEQYLLGRRRLRLYVANDSQTGFDSDYNTLFTTGTGKLAEWGDRFGGAAI